MNDKTTPVCTECGSQDVWVDASASWDMDAQRWVLEQAYQQAYCDECDGETSLDWMDEEETA